MDQLIGILLVAVLLVVIVAVAATKSRRQAPQAHDADPPMRRAASPVRKVTVNHLIPGEDHEVIDVLEMRVAGINAGDTQKTIAHLKRGEEIIWVRDPKNQYDSNAIMLFRRTGDQIGFVPRELAEEFAADLDDGMPITSTVARTEKFTTGRGGKELIGVLLKVVRYGEKEEDD